MKGNEANRVDKCIKLIIEGPANICIICNRRLYTRSVFRFHEDMYDIDKYDIDKYDIDMYDIDMNKII